MSKNELIARLRITPSFGCGPQHRTLKLVQINGNFRLDVQDWRKFGSNQKQRIPLIAADVQQQIAMLKQASITAFPVSPMVCDGAYIELTIYGESSTLNLGWWTIAPEGAEAVKAFADWLTAKAKPIDDEEG
ncbi:hypothetical protein SAMN05216296_2795 [Pseudomonas pohangensis]|uniref:Uncharacterized protein n=1 Tax=Pseudomonas pohangensis TaxID=364197 RepID=A0A1H2H6X1_9PSED|nr:hypothetical protein [Pseudomonas pohangensis]SDU27574.1 hypothetical protein SAMN05216296_2795 [Pseudomonas pohangensis]